MIMLYRLNDYGRVYDSDKAQELGHEAYRLTSWVDEEDCLFGSALAISRPDEGEGPYVNARLYKVNRDSREILSEYPKDIVVPRLITGIPDLKGDEVQEWVSDVLLYFDREELETSIHMIAKAAKVFHSKRPPAFDKYVYFALYDTEAEELSRRFPERPEITMPANTTPEHILEWHDFTRQVHRRMDRELGLGKEPQELFLEYETDNRRYAMNIYRREGQLASMQILSCQHYRDKDVWQGQFIEPTLDEESDDFIADQAGPVWDRDEITDAVRRGIPMREEVYEAYLQEAGRSLGQTSNFVLSNVICVTDK